MPEIADGEILVRAIHLSADPAQRGWAASEANYSTPVPLGGPMRALAAGMVAQSRTPEVAEGTFVYGWFDWQDYAAVTPDKMSNARRRPSRSRPMPGCWASTG